MDDSRNTTTQVSAEQELLRTFLDETSGYLASLEEQSLALEHRPRDVELLSGIFRSMHSIKGNAAFFGFRVGRDIAHELESLLARIKEDPARVTGTTVSLLLEGIDLLTRYFHDVEHNRARGEPSPEDARFLAALEAHSKAPTPGGVARAAIEEIVTRVLAGDPHAEQILRELRALDAGTNAAPAPTARIMLAHEDVTTIAGAIDDALASATGSSPAGNEGARLDRALDALAAAATRTHAPVPLKRALDALRGELSSFASEGEELDALLGEDIRDKWKRFAAESLASAAPAREQLAEGRAEAADEGRGVKLMRVDERKIDGFMRHVGELIVTSEMFNFLEQRIRTAGGLSKDLAASFHNLSLTFNSLSDELQRSLLAVRRVPIRPLMTKMQRVARDAAAHLGKEVDFETEGADEEIDKSLLELLDAPLLHLVRNAIDHGLETPAERQAAGKPRAGVVRLGARTNGDRLLVTLADDGRGVNYEKVRAKAIERGLVSSAQAARLSERELADFLFAPGFSTAAQVTDVSGRGVGLDVVATTIAKANGQVALDSVPGKGARMSLSIPLALTVVVKTGLAITVGPCEFLIPMEDVVESFRPATGTVFTVTGAGEVVKIRGSLSPLVRLGAVLDIPGACTDPAQGTCLIVRTRRGVRTLLADAIVGRQQVVLQELGHFLAGTRGFAGAAIKGNAAVGLVIDVNDLVALAEGEGR